ncbi:hypothetical protein EJB05_35409 [Eragrostis curvula]|uniref:TF-B3 domain-containing protein n=1 Tax=Eragrostis curvula TaxID=38414 RepID=A0A5J9U7Z8_9POAL|nr:hypothetical protein EJB05_35409 [Eragrostis curvula]
MQVPLKLSHPHTTSIDGVHTAQLLPSLSSIITPFVASFLHPPFLFTCLWVPTPSHRSGCRRRRELPVSFTTYVDLRREAEMLEGMGSSEFYRTLFPGDCKRKLRLPDRFAAELGDRRHAKLRLAGGGEQPLWDVKVVDDEDKYLGRGWKEFAGAHDLRDGHLLVFRYDGSDVITVTVFDETTCRRRLGQQHCPRDAAAAAAGTPVHGAAKEFPSPPAPRGGSTSADYSAGVGGSVTGSGSGSSEGGSPAVAADAEQSQFAVTLRPCNLRAKKDQYLHVPLAFQDAHGYAQRRRVTLRMGGRSWTVNLKHGKRTRGNRTSFKYGWHQFCLDNGLRVGDICIFKALREGDGGDDDDDYDDESHVLKVEVRKKDGTFLD